MAYKWKPSKAQKREFAQRMNDPEERAAYYARKEARAEKRRAGSNYAYSSAGGEYVPTHAQYEFAMTKAGDTDRELADAARMVIHGYTCNEKIHHDYIHVVNEAMRNRLY